MKYYICAIKLCEDESSVEECADDDPDRIDFSLYKVYEDGIFEGMHEWISDHLTRAFAVHQAEVLARKGVV